MSRFGLRRARETFAAFPRPFWTLVLGTFIDRLGSHMLFPFFALYLTSRFDVGMTQVAFLFATWSVISVIGATAGGALADRFGRRGIVIFGLVASGASSLLLAAADSLAAFFVVAIIVGMVAEAGWPEGGSTTPARLRRPDEWRAHWSLAQRLAPIGLVWPHPLRAGSFRPASWASAETWAHWVWPSEGPFQAALSGRIDAIGSSQLFLLCDPAARGTAEVPLLEQALGRHRRAAVVVESDAGAGDEALLRLGFREEHRLTWMTIGLAPAGRQGLV